MSAADEEAATAAFLKAFGSGADRDFARTVLQNHDWNVSRALEAVGFGENGAQVEDEVRAPMQTGYTDTLMAPLSASEERRLAKERSERIEQERKRKDAIDSRVNEDAAARNRKDAERRAFERRQKQRENADDAQPSALAAPIGDTSSGNGHTCWIDLEKKADDEADEDDFFADLDFSPPKAGQQASSTDRPQPVAEPPAQASAPASRLVQTAISTATDTAAAAAAPPAASVVAAKKSQDEVVEALVALRKRYVDSDIEGLRTCLETLKKYIQNLAKNPHEAKFQRINCDNAAFSQRIAAFEGATAVLKAVGFHEEEDGRAMAVAADFTKTKGPSLWNALSKIDVMISQVSK
eukprot:TRINITY_DN26457_c0_g1_i1.p1 TRINITY_DN26457_c0_g1~~TRINITY_DN26457_c0_g1_i1.p1  ORF type:complete len:386 (+),score=96.42 TRINITY_DN26457_c0_g1_i1:104-1159(+)